jgi:hypothetical protein
MAKYKIPDFCIVDNPTIEGIESIFTVGNEFVNVRCTIVSGEIRLYPVDLGQMPNTEDWTDEDLQNFATNALKEYEI